jgi:hypothetical protein
MGAKTLQAEATVTGKYNEILGGIVLAIAAMICFWPLSLHPADLLVGPQRDGQNDLTSQILAFRGQQSKISTGGAQALLWNPHSLCGAPWLGNPQTAMFYPPNWLYAFLDSEWVVSWLMVGHHWLAGLGTYLVCRRYGLAWSAAVFSGICFLAAPYYVANTGEGHYNPVCLVAWVPWAFLLVERLRAGQRGGVVGTALILTLAFFCGHVQELFYLALLLTAFLAVDVVQRIRVRRASTIALDAGLPTSPKPPTAGLPGSGDRSVIPGAGSGDPRTAGSAGSGGLRIVACWTAVGLAVAGLTAIELLPNWLYSRQSVRLGGLTLEEVRPMCLQSLSLLQLLDPLVMGGPENYGGPGKYYWEGVCHFGVVPFVFAVGGVCLGFRRYPVARFSVLWLAALLFAFGDQTPWFPLLYRFVLGVSLFRAPARALFFCSFFTAILAGVAWDSLLALTAAPKARWRRRILIAAGLAVCLGIGLWLWQHSGTVAVAMPGHVLAWAAAVQMLNVPRALAWTLGALGTLFLLTLGGRWRTCGVVFGLALCGSELAWHASLVLRSIPQESIRHENPILASILPGLGIDRVVASQSLVSDREAWRSGVHKVQGYEPVPLARIGLYAPAVTPRQDAALAFAGFHDLDLPAARKPLLDLLGVRYAVVPGGQRRELPGWRVLQTGRMPEEFTLRGRTPRELPFTIYENAASLPRAFVLGQATAFNMTQDVVKLLAGLDPRQTILVERDVLAPGARQSFQPAKIVSYSAAHVAVEAMLAAPGYLVLTDTYYPGWTATVDDQPATVVPANVTFRAVALERGRHVVEFRYEPPGARTGGLVSIMTVLILLVVLRGIRRKPTSVREG